MQRCFVVVRIDGDAANAEIGRRPRNADGDLAAIGDQDAFEGHG